MKSPVSHPQNDAACTVPRSSVDPARDTSPERSGDSSGDKRQLHVGSGCSEDQKECDVAKGLHVARGFATACAELVAASDKERKEGMSL